VKVLAVVLGLVFICLAVLTWTGVSHAVPAIGLNGQHHTKHTILYAVLAVLCFIWARMSTGAAATSSR
jgi:hypothetical protein